MLEIRHHYSSNGKPRIVGNKKLIPIKRRGFKMGKGIYSLITVEFYHGKKLSRKLQVFFLFINNYWKSQASKQPSTHLFVNLKYSR